MSDGEPGPVLAVGTTTVLAPAIVRPSVRVDTTCTSTFEVTRPIQLKSAALNCTPLDFSASSMASVCDTVPSAVPSLGAMR